jgi:hypothetical protein
MTELATATMDWTYLGWESPDENPCEQQYQYIIDPEPLADSWFDEGDGD